MAAKLSRDEIRASELCDAISFIAQKGWAPGTGGNFSVVINERPLKLLVTMSGVDKHTVTSKELLLVNRSGKVIEGVANPSAETLLHTTIARLTGATCILHTHTVWNTVISIRESGSILRLTGFEMLKGLQGVKSHQHEELVPVFENSQDIPALARKVSARLRKQPNMHGFLLSGHGLYTWGKSVAEARRHVEIFEFLFEVYGRLQGDLALHIGQNC
ncbi:MAG: methylthioribulose 1-phosphate dehydratase [Verrucomicrobia bacterium]|nr:methylthioribulose 1-phosphate dehydratase [Verrucomicrobiota bacterium]MDA1067102.1 methylthioribulose 1-phosphate dehydratase [Verrucomicrobiota bacterium]